MSDTTDDGTAPAGWIRRMAPFMLRDRTALVLTFTAALGGMAAQAVAPLLMMMIVDDAILTTDRALVPLLLALLGLGLFRFAIGFVRRYYGSRIGVSVEHQLRNTIYDHLHRLDFTRHDEMQTGQLVSRSNTDVQILHRLLQFLPIMSSNLLLFPVSIAFMLTLSMPLTAIAALTIPALLLLTMRMRRVVYPSSWDASQKAAAVAGVVDEAVTGVRIVKAFGQERREIDRLATSAADLYGSRVRNIRLSAVRQATLMMIPLLAQVATLALGGWLAINGRLTVGTFLAAMTYLTQLVAPIGMTAMMLVMAQMARASAERIFEILDSTPSITEADDAAELARVTGAIEFSDVSFGYVRSRPVLDGFDLRVEPGETVALVGESGSGKSTVALLLPRFYDPQAGAVRVDGTDIRTVTLDSLRANVGVVFEDSFLFSDTIRANVAYGRPDATDADVEASARAAEAHRFILDLPDGYDTVVGEHGLSLSGGQRQRLALARALLTDPRILILDDATSSIDVKVEEGIHRALRRLMAGRTTLLVAHRRSSLALADRIVVVAGGRVLDAGSHDELAVRCSTYRSLVAGTDEDIESSGPRPAAPPATASPVPGQGVAPGGIMAARAMSMAPDELEAKIAALPPADERPGIETTPLTTDHGPLELRRFIRPFLLPLIAGLALVSVDAVLRLGGPYFVRWGVDYGIVRADERALWTAVGWFVASVVAARTVSWWATVHTGRTGQKMLYTLRVRVFAQLQRLGLDFYDREMAGRIMTRMTSDIEAMNQLLQTGLVQAMVQVVTLGGTLVILFTLNVQLALVVVVVVPPLAIATGLYRRRASVAYTRVRDGVASVNAAFQESVSGMRVAQAFGREERNMSDYRTVTGSYLDARLDSQRISSVYFPFVELMSVVASVLVLGVGAGMVTDGALTAGELIAFALYITVVFAPLQQLSTLLDTYQQAKAALDKLRDLLGLESSIPEAADAIVPGRLRGAIEFSDVRFTYATGGAEVLRGVSFAIPAGQTVALVGETGAGKSTIIKLLARFYDPAAGTITVDGTPLAHFQTSAFRQQLGYVPQEPFLFSGTVRDNIAYGRPDATDAEVRDAARTVGADGFIASLPDGYDETVSERGRSLSAGQRQLIALARAFLVDPAILLLDEATANLDLATESEVNRATGTVAAGRTSILIAHRLPTAQRADRILVIDDGVVVEDGSPNALLAAGGRYAELWRIHEAAESGGDEVPTRAPGV